MQVNGRHYRTIWPAADLRSVEVIDQTLLPHRFETRRLSTWVDAEVAIRTMIVRGAPLIGATAAYGIALAVSEDASDEFLSTATAGLLASRPTAVNLRWAVETMMTRLRRLPPASREAAAWREAGAIADAEAAAGAAIGDHGKTLIETPYRKHQRPINVLTHCNAGWLASVDWGTALAPIFAAHAAGIPVHVWVDETRPRNQGASLTAFELVSAGIPHTLIADNTGGHLMQHGLVDLCIVGSDRTTATGDVCNKIGTYLKALAAHDNQVPFYVALPTSTIDWTIDDGLRQIPIEKRDAREVRAVWGRLPGGELAEVEIAPAETPAANYAFDVTPARLVSGLITEKGLFEANRESLKGLNALLHS